MATGETVKLAVIEVLKVWADWAPLLNLVLLVVVIGGLIAIRRHQQP